MWKESLRDVRWKQKTENPNPEAGEGKYEKKKRHLLEEMKMIHPCCSSSGDGNTQKKGEK